MSLASTAYIQYSVLDTCMGKATLIFVPTSSCQTMEVTRSLLAQYLIFIGKPTLSQKRLSSSELDKVTGSDRNIPRDRRTYQFQMHVQNDITLNAIFQKNVWLNDFFPPIINICRQVDLYVHSFCMSVFLVLTWEKFQTN